MHESVSSEVEHVSVVIPVYNNSSSISELCVRIETVLSQCCPRKHEVILVDDGSRDDSWDQIATRESTSNNVSFNPIQLSRNFGQHPAISAGFQASTGEIIVLMDADLEDRPEDIPLFVRAIDAGKDLAVGTIADSRTPALGSRTFHRLYAALSGASSSTEQLVTFRACSRTFLSALLQFHESDIVYGPLMMSLGFNTEFIPITRNRPVGRSTSYTFGKRLSLALSALVSHSSILPRILAFLGIVALLCVTGYALAILFARLFLGISLPSGLTLILLVILFFISLSLLAFSLITYLLLSVLREVKNRPRFLVQSAINRDQATLRDSRSP